MSKLQSEPWRTCFVVMPYGKRKAGRQVVDFDTVYKEVFKPAIRRIRVDDKATLVPKRADEASHSRILIFRMTQDLIQSRLVLADLSADNTNVGLELGIRYAAVPHGTVLLRLKGTCVPFDFTAVQVTEYSHTPPDVIPAAQTRIATALRETLRNNEADNPYYEQTQKLALRMGRPENPTKLGNLLVDAEEAASSGDLKTAIKKYAEAEGLEPVLAPLYQRRAALLVADNLLDEASLELQKAVRINPDYVEGKRWLEAIKRGDAPKLLCLDPTSWNMLNPIIGPDYQKESKPTPSPEITLAPYWREDGRVRVDLMISAKRKNKYEQIVKSVSPFGRVKDMGIVIVPERNQMFQKFSVQGYKSCESDTPDKMLSEIRIRTGIKGVKVDPRGFRSGGGRFGGGFGGGFSGAR